MPRLDVSVNGSNGKQEFAKSNSGEGWVLVFKGLFLSLAIFLLLNSSLSMHILLAHAWVIVGTHAHTHLAAEGHGGGLQVQ